MSKLEQQPAFTPATFAGIAEEIEDSVSARSRERLDELHGRLSEYFMDAVRQAPDSVVEAVRGSLPEDAPETMAFSLGQLSFAQMVTAQVTAQAAQRRAADCFMDFLHMPKYKSYVVALEHADLNGVELSRITGETEETVSRKLRELRKLGIVEFRRDGTSAINFLTPVARAAYSPDLGRVGSVSDVTILEALNNLPKQMRAATNFAQSSTVSVDV
jgi:hypothetical protein